MAIKLKIDDLEVFTERFTVKNGVVRCEKFVGAEKQNIGQGLVMLIENKSFEIITIEEPFSEIESEAWDYIRKTSNPIKFNKLGSVHEITDDLKEVLEKHGIEKISPISSNALIGFLEDGQFCIRDLEFRGNINHEEIRNELKTNGADYTAY